MFGRIIFKAFKLVCVYKHMRAVWCEGKQHGHGKIFFKNLLFLHEYRWYREFTVRRTVIDD